MPNISELKKRRNPGLTQTGDSSLLFKSLQKQTAVTQQLIKEQIVASQKQVYASNNQRQTMERLHDRLDAMVVESRVTNVLLAELVALHQSVITEETDKARDDIRNDAYYRVLNAE